MLEKIRGKNRVRLVTAAFRGKFFREPNPLELAHWIEVFQQEADIQRLLTQITQTAASGKSLSTKDTATVQLTAIDAAPAKMSNSGVAHHKLGVRAGFFYGLMQPNPSHATIPGNI